jgi:uncharacterized membrane protein
VEQEPVPILELLGLILFLGSITFLIGAFFQWYILRRNKKSIWAFVVVIVLTRVLTIISSYFIWAVWDLPFDIMFAFIFLPAVMPEVILSPLVLRLFGIEILNRKKGVKN